MCLGKDDLGNGQDGLRAARTVMHGVKAFHSGMAFPDGW
jgi:hypothetical protein